MNIALDSLLLGIVVVLAAAGTSFSIISYFQIRTRELLAVMSVFLIFLIKGVVITISRLLYTILSEPVDPIILVFDVFVLTVLFLYSFME